MWRACYCIVEVLDGPSRMDLHSPGTLIRSVQYSTVHVNVLQ